MITMPLCELHRILHEQLQILAATLKPATIKYYRTQANGFLRYLHRNYPEIHSPGQLQRNPHILGWLRSLAEDHPPLTNRSRRGMSSGGPLNPCDIRGSVLERAGESLNQHRVCGKASEAAGFPQGQYSLNPTISLFVEASLHHSPP